MLIFPPIRKTLAFTASKWILLPPFCSQKPRCQSKNSCYSRFTFIFIFPSNNCLFPPSTARFSPRKRHEITPAFTAFCFPFSITPRISSVIQKKKKEKNCKIRLSTYHCSQTQNNFERRCYNLHCLSFSRSIVLQSQPLKTNFPETLLPSLHRTKFASLHFKNPLKLHPISVTPVPGLVAEEIDQ